MNFENLLQNKEEKLCVVIPAYRVAGHIEAVLKGIPHWIWKIVVVDDKSPDDLAARVESFERSTS